MEPVFKPVTELHDIEAVVRLGKVIWNQHYVPIIGQAQVDYMLEKFQSAAALTDQIENQQYWYFKIFFDDDLVGYIGMQSQQDTLFLSKLYLTDSVRGKGLGRKAMEFCIDFAAENGFRQIELTVNKYNDIAIAAYERFGFECTRSIVTDIGGGYVMDDFVFVLPVQ